VSSKSYQHTPVVAAVNSINFCLSDDKTTTWYMGEPNGGWFLLGLSCSSHNLSSWMHIEANICQA